MPDDSRSSRVDLSVLRMDPEELDDRRGPVWLAWVVILVVLVAGGYFALLYLEPSFLLPEVETATVRQETPAQKSTVLTATGYTYARVRAAVGAKIIGRILQLPVEEGDRLAAGDLIAVLDSADLEAAVDQARASELEVRARLADAERELGRQRRLFEAEIAPRAELDAAETQIEVVRAQLGVARARLDSAKAQLEYTRIFAPIDGVVIEKNVEVGEMVAPGGFTSQQSTGAILRMADPASLEVEADVNESYIARLRAGMPVSIEVDAVPEKNYRGRLRQIVPTGDRQRAVVEVKVTIDDRDANLVPDMSCTVTFLEKSTELDDLDAAPVVYLPAAALLDPTQLERLRAENPQALSSAEATPAGSEQSYVFVVESEVARLRSVALEPDGGTASERVVAEGIRAGEVVVVEGLEELTDGQKIRRME